MAQVKLNVTEVKDFIRHIIKTNQGLQSKGTKLTSLELIGHAGLGKTSIVEQIAQELELDFVKLNLSQIEEIGD